MMKKTAILFIVEGAGTEPDFLTGVDRTFQLDCDVCSVCANIHNLYNIIKRYGFNVNIIDVLKAFFNDNLLELKNKIASFQSNLNKKTELKNLKKEQERTEKDLETLNRKYSSIYLIFDSEFQSQTKNDRNLSQMQIVAKNYKELLEMIEYFNNETEPTRGKLYLNYPMMESFRHCDYPGDPNFVNAQVSIDLLFKKGEYKRVVQKQHPKMASRHPDKFIEEEFVKIAWMNVCKLHTLYAKQWKVPSYKSFQQQAEQVGILHQEYNLIVTQKTISVLNTTLFFLLDYFGKPFYESEIAKIEA